MLSEAPQIFAPVLGGVNEAHDQREEEFATLQNVFPDQIGRLSRVPGKVLHEKYNAKILSFHQIWTPNGYSAMIVQTSDLILWIGPTGIRIPEAGGNGPEGESWETSTQFIHEDFESYSLGAVEPFGGGEWWTHPVYAGRTYSALDDFVYDDFESYEINDILPNITGFMLNVSNWKMSWDSNWEVTDPNA